MACKTSFVLSSQLHNSLNPSGTPKKIMFKAKISTSVQKHPYLYVVKISRDSGDPCITSVVNLGDSYRK